MIKPEALRFLDCTLDSAAENVALDDGLLRAVEDGVISPLLRVWELADYAVIVGRANRTSKNVNLSACRADGIPIVRRCSGGGTVLLGPGALVYSLVLRVDAGSRLVDIDGTTREVIERIRAALAPTLPDIARAGTSDLAIEDVKISGNAQRWLRRTVLHHGTLLYHFDIARMERYLTMPERVPDYRRGREHASFVRNVPLDRQRLVAALSGAWNAHIQTPCPALEPVRASVRALYGRDEWTFRR